MKEIQGSQESKYKFICLEPGDIEEVNIGGILAIPKDGLKTNKLLTMIQFDKCKSIMTDTETGEKREVKTIEDAAKRIIVDEVIDENINGLELEGQILLLPLLPNENRLEETIKENETSFTMDALQRECFTQIKEDNPYYRIDNQISKMIQAITNTYKLDPKTNFFGHSAMGLPAMRFAMVHPEQIDNLIIGGNADEIPTPIGENAEKLQYPFGIQDFKEIFGKEFNEEAFNQIAFRFYIGEYEYIDPNLDGIRDDNYGIRMDGKPGTGQRFAPKEIAENYKRIYNSRYKGDINLSVYERLQNTLAEYENAGLDIKFLVYPQDCHSPIKAQDLKNAQFENGTNFDLNGSERVKQLLNQAKDLEQYAQRSDSQTANIYKATSHKIIHNKEENDRENRTQALIGLAKEYTLSKDKKIITKDAIDSLLKSQEVSLERENAVEAINSLSRNQSELRKEEK